MNLVLMAMQKYSTLQDNRVSPSDAVYCDTQNTSLVEECLASLLRIQLMYSKLYRQGVLLNQKTILKRVVVLHACVLVSG